MGLYRYILSCDKELHSVLSENVQKVLWTRFSPRRQKWHKTVTK